MEKEINENIFFSKKNDVINTEEKNTRGSGFCKLKIHSESFDEHLVGKKHLERKTKRYHCTGMFI